MKTILSILICLFFLTNAEAKELPQKVLNNFFMLQGCYTSFDYEGHFMELYVVYDGDRCNTTSQAASLWMDGVLVQEGDCTGTAVDMTCGPVNCI